MGPRRLGFALLAALVISIAITTVFYLRVTRQGSHPSKPVVAAAVPLQPGTPIPAESLTEIAWPENVPMEGVIDKKEDVGGPLSVSPPAKGERVLRRRQAPPARYGW